MKSIDKMLVFAMAFVIYAGRAIGSQTGDPFHLAGQFIDAARENGTLPNEEDLR